MADRIQIPLDLPDVEVLETRTTSTEESHDRQGDHGLGDDRVRLRRRLGGGKHP